jgi:hypothetical protein
MSTPSDAERFRSTLSSMLYFNAEAGSGGDEKEKEKEKAGAGGSTAGAAAAASSVDAKPQCRPGDRRDFLRRLATFRRGQPGGASGGGRGGRKGLYTFSNTPRSLFVPPTTKGAKHTLTIQTRSLSLHYAHTSNRRRHRPRCPLMSRPGTWFAKPAEVGPVPCARRGWRNVEADTLECSFCKSRVILRVPTAATRDEVAALAGKVVVKLDSAHKAECGWRGNQCPVSVARFPRLPDTQLRADFTARCAALSSLPSLPRVAAPVGTALASGAVGAPPPPGTARRVAALVAEVAPAAGPAAEAVVLLALCGWQVQSVPYIVGPSSGAGASKAKAAASGAAAKAGGLVLSCQLCEARAAAWNFAAGETPEPAAAGAGAGAGAAAGGGGGSSALALAPGAAGAAAAAAATTTPGPDAKKKAKATGAALMGAMGGAFGFGAGFGGFGSSPSPSAAAAAGGFGFGAVTTPSTFGRNVVNLSFSIAGGATPGSGASPAMALTFGGGSGAKPSPPAFGAGAVRSSPFGVPQSPTAAGAAGGGGGIFGRPAFGVSPSPAPFGAGGGGGAGGGAGEGAGGVGGGGAVTIPSFGSAAAEGAEGASKRKRDAAAAAGAGAGVAGAAGAGVGAAAAAASTWGSFHPLRQHRPHCAWWGCAS